jgi:hypothetical protein
LGSLRTSQTPLRRPPERTAPQRRTPVKSCRHSSLRHHRRQRNCRSVLVDEHE